MDKKLKPLLKTLLQVSYDGPLVTEERVGAVLSALRGMGLKNHREVVRHYLVVVRRALRQQTLLIEHAGEIPSDTVTRLKSHYETLYARVLVVETRLNPELLGGVRVTVGDDIIDASIAGRLKLLARKVK